MKNRKLPFGYKMEQGRAVIHPQEAEVVTIIFRQYATGASYLDLVRMLRSQPIPYDTGRLWNKNMVARILEDKRYLGSEGYPAILDNEVFQQADKKRSKKQTPSQLTEAQKVLRRLSGQKVSREIEQQVLELLNTLIESPGIVQRPASAAVPKSTAKMESELDTIMESQPINEEAARQLILQIAATQYEAIPSEEYETQRLQHIFTKAEKMEELNAELLKSAVSEIKIASGTIAIHLKNNQTIERSAPT